MDGANARFMAGKTAWLQRHLIVYNVFKTGDSNPFEQGLGTANTELDVQEFDLRKIGGIHMNGGQGKEYELRWIDEWVGRGRDAKAREKGSNTHPIRAYFLPWGSNRSFVGKLGNAADFFFTPTLNGCTFAYSDNGAAPSVGHANFRNPATDLADQNAVNIDLIQKFGAMPPNRLIKTDYKRQPIGTEDYRATVIGIRSGGGWRFYYQNYMADKPIDGPLTRTGLDMCQEI